jgi:hypothetical protein
MGETCSYDRERLWRKAVTMSEVVKSELEEEVFELRVVSAEDEPFEAGTDFEPDDHPPADEIKEEFWAGRNHAMRMSARIAA